MSVAIFIYQAIYCRYLTPGECIVHDRGSEFCNEVSTALHQMFGADVRVISANRPQGNGQVEAMVKNIKEKMKALMAENSNTLPVEWDQTLLHKALQIIRCDPSSATGYAPAQLLLGRELYYPMDLKTRDVDFTGTELTNSVVQALNNIHNETFGKACEKIQKHQQRYKAHYDKKDKVTKVVFKVGNKVQMKKGVHELKSKTALKWKPRSGYYEIIKVNPKHRTALLKNPQNGYIFKKTKPYSALRNYRSRK